MNSLTVVENAEIDCRQNQTNFNFNGARIFRQRYLHNWKRATFNLIHLKNISLMKGFAILHVALAIDANWCMRWDTVKNTIGIGWTLERITTSQRKIESFLFFVHSLRKVSIMHPPRRAALHGNHFHLSGIDWVNWAWVRAWKPVFKFAFWTRVLGGGKDTNWDKFLLEKNLNFFLDSCN